MNGWMRGAVAIAAGTAGLAVVPVTHAGETESATRTILVAQNQARVPADRPSMFAGTSADGRYVAFASAATNLVPVPAGTAINVYLRDERSSTVELISRTPSAAPGHLGSGGPHLPVTPDGRFVAFDSLSADLVPGDANGVQDVFVRQRGPAPRTILVSVATTGAQANGPSITQAISADGRYVLFTADATNLVPGDTNGQRDVFVRDTRNRTTERVDVSTAGTQTNGYSPLAAMSGDARYVVFQSTATNLVSGDTNGAVDVFVRDRLSGTTERVSVDNAGQQLPNGGVQPSISADGRYVVFSATGPGGVMQVYLRDRVARTTRLVSLNSAGVPADTGAGLASISPDGHLVLFASGAGNLGGPRLGGGAYLRDLRSGTTVLASVNDAGTPASLPAFPLAAYDHGGLFRSMATNLVPGTPVNFLRVYLRTD
jgi:Tol biopolymer transport system component